LPAVAPFNRNYFEVSGTPNVTEATTFEVKVTGSNGSETWYYRSKPADGSADYGDYNTAITLAVDTLLQLGSTGIYIKFTRSSATSYTPGDKWVFSTQADVKLDDSAQFDHIETIDVGEERHLLAISSGTGRVATINNIDGSSPEAESYELNIGGSPNGTILDLEKRNKELYIGKGRDVHPQWLGYSKNNGFEGVAELELKTNPAMDLLEGASNPQTDAYDMSVILRGGGGANLNAAKIAVGINNVTTSGAIKDSVTVQDLINDKVYEYGCVTTPISVKRWYGKSNGNYCDGFAVLRKPEKDPDTYAGTIDLWSLNTALGGTIGQQANMYQTIQLKKPDGESNVQEFGDFYIVPETSEYAKWYIVLSRARSRTQNYGNTVTNWLWRTQDYTTSQLHANGLEINGDDYDDITPQLSSEDASPSSKGGNEMYYMQRCIHAGGDVTVNFGGTNYTSDMPDFVMVHSSFYGGNAMRPRITEDLNYGCISFAGFNNENGSYGTNPYISFTARVGPDFSSRGAKHWYGANSCFQSTAQKQINTGVNVSWTANTAHSMSGWHTECVGPFQANDAGNTYQINYRPIKWCTWMIDVNSSNYGQAKYKCFPHMLDWAEQGTTAKKWRTFKANQTFTIPNWVTSIENESGEGEQNKTSGTNPNKGIIKLAFVPSRNPVFGTKGRIIFSTYGTKRRRHLMHYVRPGNRAVYSFRFGTESQTPQALNDTANPMMFPNSWLVSDGNINEPDYQSANAYASWNANDTASAFSSNFYDTSVKANNHRRYRSIPVLGAGGDDKMAYRPGEHGNVTLDVGGIGNTTQWYPQDNDCFHVFGVKYGGCETKAYYKARFAGTAAFTNEYSGAVSEFVIQTPTESGDANSWSGVIAKKVFYKASLIYDGYQETPLLSVPNSFFKTGGIDQSIDVEIRIKDTYNISERVTGVALYRATSQSDADLTEPETLYRFVEEIPLFQFNHSAIRGDQSFTVRDTGDAEGTYESINGVSEKIYDLAVNYTVNAQQNGYHFISNCSHSQIADAENYLLRSQPGKFAIFDWTKDFVELPFIPSSLIGFQGKIYAFSTNQTAIINPETLFIEDVIEGVGCINSKTSLICDAGLVWADYRNIYLASPSMQPIGSTILNVKNDGWLNLTLDEKKNVRCGYDSKRKAFLFFFTRGTDTHRCWGYSFEKRRWDLFETPNKVMDTTLTKDGSTILLLKDNKLAKFLAHTELSKDWYWESKRISMGNTMVDKKIRNFKTENSHRTLTSMKYKLDGDTDWVSGQDVSSSFTGDQNRAYKLASADTSKKVHWLKLKLEGDNSSAGTDAKTFATSIIYKPKRPK